MFAGVFGRHASAYRARLDAAVARGEARGRALVVRRLRLAADGRVLDLGCGPGVLSGPLRAAVGAGGLVVGVDLALEMLALASAGPFGVALARMDIERLGLAGDSFDAVACGHALHFCPDLGRALAEARRVLRPGGRFAASVPGPAPPSDPASLLLEEMVAARVPANEAERPPELAGTLAVLADRERMAEALAAAGLRGASVELVEERSTYATPQDLVDHRLGWWSCAWRLESLGPAEREALREEAVRALRARFGEATVVVPGASWVLSGER